MQVEKHNQELTRLRLECLETDKIKGILLMQALKTGAKIPSKEETDIIAVSVQKNFRDFNLERINDAFDWYASLPLESKMQHYGTFSYDYVAQVLSSFKRHLIAAGSIVSNVDKERTYIPAERQLGNGDGKLPDDELIELARQMFESTGNVHFIPHRCYDVLKLNLSREEKDTIRRQAAAELAEQHKTSPIENYEKTLNRLCKKIAVSKYFKK